MGGWRQSSTRIWEAHKRRVVVKDELWEVCWVWEYIKRWEAVGWCYRRAWSKVGSGISVPERQ